MKTLDLNISCKYTLLLFIVILTMSCEKFVDIKRSNSQRLVETLGDAQLLLDNYNIMNINYPADGELSSDNYYLTDAGYNSLTLQADRDLYIWLYNGVRTVEQWQSSYQVVYYANLAMETAESLKGSESQSAIDFIRGEGLFFRAYAFFQVAQLYANPYITTRASTDPGIPIRLSSDFNIKSERGTLQSTYSQVLSDLKASCDLLPDKAVIASRPSKVAAYALLARVYLSMQDYNNALTYASNALGIQSDLIDYNTLDVLSPTPFARFNTEVIFHSVMRGVNPLNPGTATNNTAKINPELLALYNPNDLRLALYFKANTGVHAGTFRFSGNYEPTTSSTMFNGLTVDEMLLIRAECNARSGDIVSSLADLNRLLRSRYKTGTFTNQTATNSDEALTSILLERRKELVMRGQRWTDLRRLNFDTRFAKSQSRIVNGTSYILPPNDLRYTLLIPNDVITNSDMTIFQNPR